MSLIAVEIEQALTHRRPPRPRDRCGARSISRSTICNREPQHSPIERRELNPTYDAQDRLLTYGAASYTYTADGELTGKSDASGTSSYSYDALGNLLNVGLPDTTAIAYIPDGRNRRVGKEISGALHDGFLYQDALNIAAKLDGSGSVVITPALPERRAGGERTIGTSMARRRAENLGRRFLTRLRCARIRTKLRCPRTNPTRLLRTHAATALRSHSFRCFSRLRLDHSRASDFRPVGFPSFEHRRP